MSKYDFLSPKEDEEIILVVRQHPWFFFTPVLWILFFVMICMAIYIESKSGPIVSWTTVIVAVLMLYIISRSWYTWYSQTYIITSDRIVSVEQKGWFTHSVGEAVLENVLFINHVVKGPIKAMLNFGDVHIRASGVTEDELVFRNVANPYDIQQIIVKAQRKKISSKESSENHQTSDGNKPILR